MTKGELYIAQIITSAHYKYIPEKTFTDLKGGKFRYDFYLPNLNGGTLIEYQGEQHYINIPYFYKNNQEFKKAQGRDMSKITYALSRQIKLYLIPYWELENIKNIKDLLQDKFLARDRYKNLDDFKNYQNTST